MLSKTKEQLNWEKLFEEWALPPGRTEQEKCERTIRAIKEAISNDPKLNAKKISTFTQGSYANRTNVRKDSDVDVCAFLMGAILVNYPDGVGDSDVGLHSSDYSYSEYKADIYSALIRKFGPENVMRGNKAIDVNENLHSVDADVAACFEYREYFRGINGKLNFIQGTALFSDDGHRLITNFPEQQYQNGVKKNDETSRRYKKHVRIIKKLCNEMAEDGNEIASNTPSFLIESLVWNAPNFLFDEKSHHEITSSILANAWGSTNTDEKAQELLEVNGVKFLFHPSQSWTRIGANAFAAAAWGYIN